MLKGRIVVCRHCGSTLTMPFLDLGSAPPSNAYLSEKQLNEPELCYPLRLLACTHCWLVQTEDYAGRETLFTEEYPYFSSFSRSWIAHAQKYVGEMIHLFGLSDNSTVVEIGANDGYLLQFVKKRGIPCYGIEPTLSTAEAARRKGIKIYSEFFGLEMGERFAAQRRMADLIVANNVLAHVPDINDFVSGFTHLLKPHGVATFEFPHLLQMVTNNQFDTAYHEHYSYLSLGTVSTIFEHNGLSVFDVQECATHGGSLRVFAQKTGVGEHLPSHNVAWMLEREHQAGMSSLGFYSGVQSRAQNIKDKLLSFFLKARQQGKTIGAYGAAAKGNTLLNFCGIEKDFIEFVADANPKKQGKYLPGSHIPVVSEKNLVDRKPDYILILPWNLKEEITNQLDYIRQWGGKFLVPIPQLDII